MVVGLVRRIETEFYSVESNQSNQMASVPLPAEVFIALAHHEVGRRSVLGSLV